MKRLALCIGINEYKNGVAPLSCAVSDSEKVAAALKYNGFAVEVLNDDQANQEGIVGKLHNAVKQLEKGDIFVFYFSGHGVEDPAHGQHYLLGVSAMGSPGLIAQGIGVVPMSTVDFSTALPGVHRLFILDTCRSQLYQHSKNLNLCAASRGMAMEKLVRSTPDNILPPLILNSCSVGEAAWEDPDNKQGFFTQALLKTFNNKINKFSEFKKNLKEIMQQQKTPFPQNICWNGSADEWENVLLLKHWDTAPANTNEVISSVTPIKIINESKGKKLDVYGRIEYGELYIKLAEAVKAIKVSQDCPKTINRKIALQLQIWQALPDNAIYQQELDQLKSFEAEFKSVQNEIAVFQACKELQSWIEQQKQELPELVDDAEFQHNSRLAMQAEQRGDYEVAKYYLEKIAETGTFDPFNMVSRYMQPGDDDLVRRALEIVLLEKKASTSYIQRRLRIGYKRAAELIELMEERGIVGPPSGSGAKRDILVFDDIINK